MFENRVLRRVFEPKRKEVTGELRKLHNEELNDLYASPNTVFARVICALFLSILAAEKSGCVKYADFFLWPS